MAKGNETQRRSFGSGLELMAGSRPGGAAKSRDAYGAIGDIEFGRGEILGIEPVYTAVPL